MKVKEFIEHLQKLDQDRDVWIIYDTYLPVIPAVDDVIKTESDAEYFRRYEGDVKVGDYVITV